MSALFICNNQQSSHTGTTAKACSEEVTAIWMYEAAAPPTCGSWKLPTVERAVS